MKLVVGIIVGDEMIRLEAGVAEERYLKYGYYNMRHGYVNPP